MLNTRRNAVPSTGDEGANGATSSTLPAVGRDRYLDLLRAVAILRVVVLHTAGAPWMTLVFPSMGIMFTLGGALMAASLDRRKGVTSVIRGRMRRLLPPLWMVAAVAVPLMWWEAHGSDEAFRPTWQYLFWLLPVGDPPAGESELGGAFTGVLWYLRAYLWFVLLSPLLLRIFRLSPWAALAVAVCGVVALDLSAVGGEGVLSSMLTGSEGLLSSFVVYLACWLLGFAYHDGLLSRVSGWATVLLAAGLAAAGLWWTYRAEQEIEFSFLSLYDSLVLNTLLSLAFALVLLRFRPGAGLIDRVVPLRVLTDRMNSRAVTVYLWHYPLLPLVWWLSEDGEFAGWPVPEVVALICVEFSLVLVAACVFGWVEDLAARRRPSLLGGGRKRSPARG